MRWVVFILVLAFSTSATAQTQQAQPSEIEDLMFTINVLSSDVAELERQAKQSKTSTERDDLKRRAQELREEQRLDFSVLVGKWSDQLNSDQKSRLVTHLKTDNEAVVGGYKEAESSIFEHRVALEETTEPEQILLHEDEIDEARREMVDYLMVESANITRLETLGVDTQIAQERFEKQLEKTARVVSSTLTGLLNTRRQVSERAVAGDEDKAKKKSDLARINERVTRGAEDLGRIIDLLKNAGKDATKYQQLVIESTGTITADILDKDVSLGLVQKWLKQAQTWVAQNAVDIVFKLLWFFIILVLAKFAGLIARKIAKQWLKKTGFSSLAREFFERASGRIVFGIGVLFGLTQLGFDVTALIAGFGVAGIVIGFALQETLANFASGMMILFYRPFDTGDLIRTADVEGVVDKMTLVSTEVLTLDNQRFIIPNNKVWGSVIQNVTAERTRRVDLTFGVGYESDLDQVETLLADVVENEPHVLTDPEPIIRLHELADSSLNFVVRIWVNTDDYWDAYWNLTRQVKDAFDEAGVNIPFPQRDVHLIQPDESTERPSASTD